MGVPGNIRIKDYCMLLYHLLSAIAVAAPLAEASSFGPYFFVCNYHGKLSSPQQDGKLLLSVNVDGNPRSYIPEKEYTVKITSSKDFNGLLITGLFSSTMIKSKLDRSSFGMTSIGYSHDSPVAKSEFMCGTIYSDIYPQRAPKSQVTFYWTAPPAGTGCVSFLLTASLGMQIVFQDVVSYQICEDGQVAETPRPSLADVHSDGVIIRDDFDSAESGVWSALSEGFSLSDACGEISHGNAAVFCGGSPTNKLVSPVLNLTTAEALQFTVGSGTCQPVFGDIIVSSTQSDDEWTTISEIVVGQASQVTVIQIPEVARKEYVRLKFAQRSEYSSSGCWAVDNVLVTSKEPYPKYMYENMDLINITNWLFMPGASIKGGCLSQGNAMIFSSSSDDPAPTFSVTQDLDLSTEFTKVGITDAVVKGGSLHPGACGHERASLTYKFDGSGTRSYCTTPADGLDGKAAVTFVLSRGSGECEDSNSHDDNLEVYIIIGHDRGATLATFAQDAYKRPKKVVVQIPAKAKVDGAVICIEQVFNKEEGMDVWAIDSFSFIENPTEFHYFMQFTINMACATIYTDSRVEVEYSTDYGRSWHMLQEECLPETCQGSHWSYNSSYKSHINEGWFRVMIPLPVAALGDHTRFRWILVESGEGEIVWAIDNIYIGSDKLCPDWCGGHGTCESSGCRCDAGYTGASCSVSTHILPTFLASDFNSRNTLVSGFEAAYGSQIGYACGLLGNGKAMVFNGVGKRMLITKPLNATMLRFLQFSILMGRHSTTGTCQPPSKPGDGILVHYTTTQGVSWHLLDLIPFDSNRETRAISIPLPIQAAKHGLQVRWWQPNEQLEGKAVWALDDVSVAKDLYKSIYSDEQNFYRIYSTSVSFHTGQLTDFCNRTNVLLFSPAYQLYNEEHRYAETQTMEVSDGYILEADVTLKCDLDENSGRVFNGEDINHEVALQYSRDHGVTWNLVQEENLPGSVADTMYYAASVYHVSEFQKWTKVTVPLPKKTWSSHLRLRVIQSDQATSLWALDNVYMGPACEMNCHNNGRCRNGQCICDVGSVGPSCLPTDMLPPGVNDQFDDINRMIKAGWSLIGAQIADSSKDKNGCGPMPSSHYLHMNKAGVRKVVTPDLDTSYSGQIQFYIRIGGGNCRVPTDRANGVLLQFSNDGGITWDLLDELYYMDYQVPTYVHRDIPPQAMTRQTRFRWWQPRNDGADHDQWSLSEVIVGEPMLSNQAMTASKILSSRRSVEDFAHTKVKTFILLSNEGQAKDFCEPQPGSYVFNKAKGDRFATTDDFKLEEGDTIQFELNIGCSHNFSWSFPVLLEFSQDGGYSWDLVARACYPAGRPKSQMTLQHAYDDITAHDCTGQARELKEGSIYYKGDFKQWRRVTISISSRVAAMPVRFRWWQRVPAGIVPTSWAIKSVYIGQSCHSFCSGHGTCTVGVDSERTCQCDRDRGGDTCEYTDEPTARFWDHVPSSSHPDTWWQTVLGFSGENHCGELHKGAALYFGEEGTRIAETISLDTTGVRLIQFYFRLGSSDDTAGCSVPTHRDEAVLLQYSNDNGISWNLIKELSFNQYNSRSERITVDIPFGAKTQSTSFRWWQPLHDENDHRSQWAIDDIFIGVPNLREQGLAEDFENGLLDTIWYKVQSGAIGAYSLCDGHSDRTSKSLIVSSGGVAETWDFRLNSGTLLQFELAMDCEGKNPANDVLNLEYSTDLGISWQAVLPVCVPGSSVGCEHGLGSSFYAGLNQHWTRHTLALPSALTGTSKIRFRWIQYFYGGESSTWAIDNIYLGSGCPWMCGGHGRCWPPIDGFEDRCICDQGFEAGPYCEPSMALPTGMLDTFDLPWNSNETYSIMAGREAVKINDLTSVGIMVGGENLQMGGSGIRMLQTRTLNTTNTKYIQFYICFKGAGRNPASTIVLQGTNNNGIKWSTIHLLSAESTEDDEKSFVHVVLPRNCRLPAVSFRWWQASIGAATPIFEKSDEVWALENLAIGGHVVCDRHFLKGDFTEANEKSLSLTGNWLFHPGSQVSSFCGSHGGAVVFRNNAGEHSVSTVDLCVSENYVIQFKIAVGCSVASSSSHAVQLEFSTDQGITWSLVRPHCQGNEADPAGCTDELQHASIYYPGAVTGWQRIIIPLDRHHICSSVRFRWYQGFYMDDFESAKAVHWGLDDVYIGPGCDEMCNGHGICVDEGEKCLCDPGFTGKTCCDVTTKHPTFFHETFDRQADKKLLLESGKWVKLAGGDVAFTSAICHPLDGVMKQWVFRSDQPGERIMETQDLDMRNAVFVQFYMRLNHQAKSVTAELTKVNGDNDYSEAIGNLQPVAESLYLQFSTDGGIQWSLLEVFPFISANFDQSQYIALHLPEAARGNTTRFRWWQPARNGESEFGFVMDQIVIGGQLPEIDDDFSSVNPSHWLEVSGGMIQPGARSVCCNAASKTEGCNILELGNNNRSVRTCGSNFAVTNGANVVPGSFISFNLQMNCRAKSGSCEAIELQYSSDLGHTWLPLILPCYPNQPDCIRHHQGSTFTSDVYPTASSENHLSRIIVPLPEHAWSPATRFRWLQRRDVHSGSWAIRNVYVGSACPGACSGRGRCHDSECICDDGWTGVFCMRPTRDLPSELKDVFAQEFSESPGSSSRSLFRKLVGGQIDRMCGEVGYDQALHFFQPCSRLLETMPLNTTQADFVQFMFRTGCGASPMTERNHGVLVDYTANGGAVWHNLAEIYYKDYNSKPGFVNILLPHQAKGVGVQFRWWQPEHSGLNHNDWAIDNLLIGGAREEQMLSDDFSVLKEIGPAGLWFDRDDKDMWEFYDNTEPDSFCGRDDVILAGTVPGLDATISTKDFLPEKGFIMQYTIVVLCEDVQKHHQPVHVQFSTDFGDTWQYLVGQCIPSDKDCFGKEVTQPSAHFISPDWRRRTIWIPSSLFGQHVRFRFHQAESDVLWALDRLFIGPACPDACSGHGDCIGVAQDEMFIMGEVNYDARRCLCDFGYEAPNCFLSFEHEQKYLKDDFNMGMKIGGWSIAEAEKIDVHCGLMVDGNSLSFDGVGPRQVETVDLDLRDAKFVKHNVVIGGVNGSCLPAKMRQDGILLQYSTDGGISWEMIHSMDYISYPHAKSEYILLPLEAKRNATRLRWWQPFTFIEKTGLVGMGEDRAGWALDNVYIGGHEVNTYHMADDFEVQYDILGNPGPLDEELYDFYPNGLLTMGQCPGDDSVHMTWPGGDPFSTEQSLTTRELIVTQGHMIQFKIKIGCGEHECTQEFPVKLEYREDPRYNDWKLVKPECYPATPPSPGCPPYTYHDPSVYTLDRDHEWGRITIPLDDISSGTTQFRWSQAGGAMDLFSWAVDDIYIGESCAGYCTGHGRCTKTLECICDEGFTGDDCSEPMHRYLVPVFRDNFEREVVNTKRWLFLSGGVVSSGGCGPLRPFGFSRSLYFGGCGQREILTREMDLVKSWQIQYVIQVGSVNPTKECHITEGGLYDRTPMSVVVLQFTTNKGITWQTLREHSSAHYGTPRRVSQALPSAARTKRTILRWWQPTHGGKGEDQWALDNVDIAMSRRQRHLHLLDYQWLLRKHQLAPDMPVELEVPSEFNHMLQSPVAQPGGEIEPPPIVPAREKLPPTDIEDLP